MMADIRRQDSVHHFVPNMVDKIGYPLWQQAATNESSSSLLLGSGSSVFLIPFQDEKSKRISAYLSCVQTDGKYNYSLHTREAIINRINKADTQKLKEMAGFGLVLAYFEKQVNKLDSLVMQGCKLPAFKNASIGFEPPRQPRTLGEFVWVTSCGYVLVTSNGQVGGGVPPGGSLEYGSWQWQCQTSIQYVQSFPADGSGGGGIGGDPCIAPDGSTYWWCTAGTGGGGGGIDPPPPPDPCRDAQPAANATTTLSQSSSYSSAKSNIQGADPNVEHSVTFGKDANGNITASSMTSCTSPSSCLVNTGWPGAFADLHNHPNDQPPSPGDMYNLIKVSNNHSGYNTRIVVAADGSVFALVVLDLNAANVFKTNYPPINIGFGPDFPTEIFDKFQEVKDVFMQQGFSNLVSEERAMSFVLDKYKTGIVLLKQDSNGNFKRLKAEESTSDGGIITYIANNCQ
jgi:hypothetical protein